MTMFRSGVVVVPVMECGRRNHILQPAKPPAQIGMDKVAPHASGQRHRERYPVHPVAGPVGQAQKIERQIPAQAHEHQVDGMRAGVYQPVHPGGTVMDRVESPQPGALVHPPMPPVEADLRTQHGSGQPRPAGQSPGPLVHAGVPGSLQAQRQCRDGQHQEPVRQQTAEEIVADVRPELRAQHLLQSQGKEPLQGYQEYGEQDQAVGEPDGIQGDWRQVMLQRSERFHPKVPGQARWNSAGVRPPRRSGRPAPCGECTASIPTGRRPARS